jgi:hypothetical protein
MEWMVLVGILLAGLLGLVLAALSFGCASGETCHPGAKPPDGWKSIRATCEDVLREIESQKRRLENRSAMMEELIERADRQIEELQERVAALGRRRTLSETERQMLTLLRAGGFDRQEISRFVRHDDSDPIESE